MYLLICQGFFIVIIFVILALNYTKPTLKKVMRKRRTRQHFIEDLGFNYVEKQALLGRCTIQRITHDYGLDAEMHTYEENGEVEVGGIHIQIKSTDKIKLLKTRKEFAFDLSKPCGHDIIDFVDCFVLLVLKAD